MIDNKMLLDFLETFIQYMQIPMMLMIFIGAIYVVLDFKKKLFSAYIDENTSKNKKSYQEEMSIYDDSKTESPSILPYSTGMSLENLLDGEIPDEAFLHANGKKGYHRND